MRRLSPLFLLLAVAVAIAIALPAGAAKPDKPDKPPKPSTSAPVAVYLDADPIWVHEDDDVIRYTVTIQNKTDAEVTVTIDSYLSNPVKIDPRGVVTIEDLFSYDVTPGDIAAAADIVGTVTVSYVGGEITAETSTVVDPVDLCNLNALTAGEVCIWKPTATGEWTVRVTPDDLVTRPTRMMVSVRDGVPGNWCTVPDVADTGVVVRRLMPGDTVFELQVFLPGDSDFPGLDDGQCYSGGAGGDYFVVGNPDSFYLYTSFDGSATVTYEDG